MMVFCSSCSHPLEEREPFCSYCGALQISICSKCYKESQFGDLFCRHCGSSLAESKKKGSEASLRKVIDQSPSVIEQSKYLRRYCSILFSDISPNEKKKNIPEEELKAILSPIIDQMLEAVYYYDGTVIHIFGNGLIAIFGAPRSKEDHALRACLAALKMKSNLAIQQNLPIRVGINSGEILVEKVAVEANQPIYDITGSNVNLAARMEQTAQLETIQITKSTWELSKQNIKAIPLGSHKVKGFSQPVESFLVKGLKDYASLSEQKNRPILFPFTGRQEELERLHAVLRLAMEGHGQLMGITAEAGQGKSRLIEEFLNSPAAKACRILIGGAFSHTAMVPLDPISKLFRNLMEVDRVIQKGLPATEAVEPFLLKIDLSNKINAALTLVNELTVDSEWNYLSYNVRLDYICQLGFEILNNLSQEKPIIFLIEDLHWIDPDSEYFLSRLQMNITHSHILILTTSRPNYTPPWYETTQSCQIHLSRMDNSDERRILDLFLGDSPSLSEIKSKLINQSAGNPFFLQELTLSLINADLIVGKQGSYQLDQQKMKENIELPDSIYSVLQAELDKIPEEETNILQTGFIYGEQFSYNALSEILEMDQQQLRNGINHLIQSQFIYEIQIFPEIKFSSKHALIQEVVYNSMLKQRRRDLHAKALNYIEKQNEGKSQQKLEVLQGLAHHAYRAQDWNKSYFYNSLLADRTHWINNRLSTEFYEKAIKSARSLKLLKEDKEKLTKILLNLSHCYLRLGKIDKQMDCNREALSLAEFLENKELQGAAHAYFSYGYSSLNEIEKAYQSAIRSHELANQSNSEDVLHMAQLALTCAYLFSGDFQQLSQVGDEILQDVAPLNRFGIYLQTPIRFVASTHFCFGLLFMGEFEKAKIIIERFQAEVNLTELSLPASFTLLVIGMRNLFLGRAEEALSPLQQANKMLTEMETLFIYPTAFSALGMCYLLLGEKKNALSYLEKAVEYTEKLRYTFYSTSVFGLIADALTLSEQYDKAEQFIQKTLDVARKYNLAAQIVWLSKSKAALHLKRGQFDHTLEAEIKAIIEKCGHLNLKPQEAYSHSLLADYYQFQGDHLAAKREHNTFLKICGLLGINVIDFFRISLRLEK